MFSFIFKKRGLAINANECSSLCIKLLPAKKQLYCCTKEGLTVGGTQILCISGEGNFKYLGFKFTFQGISDTSELPMSFALDRIMSAPLKPHQKFVLLNHYTIPKYPYSAQSPTITSAFLRKTDRLLRFYSKRMLHLPKQTSNALLHASTKDGGLGLFCLGVESQEF